MNRIANCALVVWTLSAACGVSAGAVVGPESFEAGLGGWAKDSAAVGTPALNAGAARVNDPAHTGRWCTMLDVSGGNPTGTVWLERKIEAAAGMYEVAVTFWVWSPGESVGNASDVLAAVGSVDPEKRSDLAIVGSTATAAGWSQHTLRKSVTIGTGESVWIAVGFGANSPENRKYGFDDVAVEISPRGAGCAADFDGSGSVTMADLSEFLSKWLSGNPAADFDASGRLDTLDIYAFLGAWSAGCEGPR